MLFKSHLGKPVVASKLTTLSNVGFLGTKYISLENISEEDLNAAEDIQRNGPKKSSRASRSMPWADARDANA